MSSVWQPIETAPKDGTRVLAYQPAGQWSGRGSHRGVLFAVVYWHQPANPESAGFWLPSLRPTHWMPLPSAPTQSVDQPASVAAADRPSSGAPAAPRANSSDLLAAAVSDIQTAAHNLGEVAKQMQADGDPRWKGMRWIARYAQLDAESLTDQVAAATGNMASKGDQ